MLQGHKDFCYSVKFLDWPYVASGSYDVSVRVFDIRKPGSQIYILPGLKSQIGALEYFDSNSTLVCLEEFGYIYAYNFSKGVPARQVETYFGGASGVAKVPSALSFIVSIIGRTPGILKFNISA